MKPFLFFALVLLSFTVLAQDKSEPKSSFTLSINGEPYTVTEGQLLKLDHDITKPVITVKLAENKQFDNSFASFLFPRNFSYEYEEETGFKNWTLAGNDLTILLFELDGASGTQDLAENMIKKFGKKNCKLETASRKLGGQTLEGHQLHVTLVGQKLNIDILKLKSDETKSRFMILQDTPKEDGTDSDESAKAIGIIDMSLNYK